MSIFNDVCELASDITVDFNEFKKDISVDLIEIKDDVIELYDKKSLGLTCYVSDFMNEITNRITWSVDDLIEGIDKPIDFVKAFIILPTVPFISAGEMAINIMKIRERTKVVERRNEFNKKYENLREDINNEVDKNHKLIINKYIKNQILECYQLLKEFKDELSTINSFIDETEKNLLKLINQISNLQKKQIKKDLELFEKFKEEIKEELSKKYTYKEFLQNKIELMKNSIESLEKEMAEKL